MSTFAERRDKVVDALGATAHPLSWALYAAECGAAAGTALGGVVAAARWTPWGWPVAAAGAAWLVGVLRQRWRPLLHRVVFGRLL